MPLVSENTRTEIGISKVLQPITSRRDSVYDAADNVIETHEHKGDFKEP
jgi:hypothetical protein